LTFQSRRMLVVENTMSGGEHAGWLETLWCTSLLEENTRTVAFTKDKISNCFGNINLIETRFNLKPFRLVVNVMKEVWFVRQR
jgi:hypothetical protein